MKNKIKYYDYITGKEEKISEKMALRYGGKDKDPRRIADARAKDRARKKSKNPRKPQTPHKRVEKITPKEKAKNVVGIINNILEIAGSSLKNRIRMLFSDNGFKLTKKGLLSKQLNKIQILQLNDQANYWKEKLKDEQEKKDRFWDEDFWRRGGITWAQARDLTDYLYARGLLYYHTSGGNIDLSDTETLADYNYDNNSIFKGMVNAIRNENEKNKV